DSFAIAVSQGLQYGVPLKRFVKSFRGASFAPSGITDDKDIRTASSITDYIFRRLALDYLPFDDRLELGLASIEDMPDTQTSLLAEDSVPAVSTEEAEAVEEVATPTVAHKVPEVPQKVLAVGEKAEEKSTAKEAKEPVAATTADQAAPL